MGVINRFAQGALDLIGAKSDGRLPNQLGEVVNPTLDMSRFYKAQRFDQASNAGTFLFTGTGPILSVPNTEAWEVLSFFGQLSFNVVGQSASIRLLLANLPSGATVVKAMNEPIVSTSTDQIVGLEYIAPEPFIMLPGQSIRTAIVDLDLNGAPSLIMNTYALIYRYSI